jgi:hypothetical protein
MPQSANRGTPAQTRPGGPPLRRTGRTGATCRGGCSPTSGAVAACRFRSHPDAPSYAFRYGNELRALPPSGKTHLSGWSLRRPRALANRGASESPDSLLPSQHSRTVLAFQAPLSAATGEHPGRRILACRAMPPRGGSSRTSETRRAATRGQNSSGAGPRTPGRARHLAQDAYSSWSRREWLSLHRRRHSSEFRSPCQGS